MPELPEIEALAAFLRERAVGHAVARLDTVAFSALKTFDPPPTAIAGLEVTGAGRHGKFLDIEIGGSAPGAPDALHLVTHLARAGWLQWREKLPPAPPKPGRGPIAARLRLDDGSGFDLTEQGTQKRLAVYLVRDPARRARHRPARPRPARRPRSPPSGSRELLTAHGGQLKGVLTDQTLLAGIGNAYSDEILHIAKLSPFKPAGRLSEGERRRAARRAGDHPAGRGRAVHRAESSHAQGGEAVRAAGARPHRAALPGLRRHRPRGVLRHRSPCSTAPPARPAASRSPTGGCPSC